MTLLCEYLDNELSIKDRARFEKRLQQSPELIQALEDMTALKQNMRSLPRRPVPHQFTLTRSEAEKARRGRFLLPTFGWASAICMMLLAVIFGSEFIFANFSAPQTVSEPVAVMLPDAAAPESALRQAEEEAGEPVYLLNWGSVDGKGGGGAGGSGLMSGGMPVGMGGGLIGTTVEDTMMAEPMQIEEAVEPTEVASTFAEEEKPSVEPLIFGIREDQLGQVVAIEPVETPAPTVAAVEEVVEQEKEPLVPTNVKLVLAGLAAVFGLIWLLLKFKALSILLNECLK